MRKLPQLLLLILLSACRGADAVEEDPLGVEAERILIEYLKIDTTNPPGNETAAAEFLLSIFKREGIEARLVGPDPKRRGIYARLSSGSSEKALLLLSHIDVVPATSAEWTVPPFAGVKSGGYIWGRGALDSKSLGVAQLISMVALKRSGVPLGRDVVFLAVPDEEAGGMRGAKIILEQHPELFTNVGFVLNEGGGNKTVVDRITWWGIEVDQKVPLWLEISTRGGGGHASMPTPSPTAITKLLSILRDLEALPMEREDPQRRRVFEGGLTSADNAAQAVLSRDTLIITAIRAGTTVNSLPPHASALIDCRLVPGRSPDALLARIRQTVGDRGTVNVLVASEPAAPSSTRTPLYDVLAAQLVRAERGSRVSPMTSPGTTDSRFFRARGITAYGFSPFKLNYYDYDTIHGTDEKIRSRFFIEGTHVMRNVVAAFCKR